MNIDSVADFGSKERLQELVSTQALSGGLS